MTKDYRENLTRLRRVAEDGRITWAIAFHDPHQAIRAMHAAGFVYSARGWEVIR